MRVWSDLGGYFLEMDGRLFLRLDRLLQNFLCLADLRSGSLQSLLGKLEGGHLTSAQRGVDEAYLTLAQAAD